MPFLIIAIVALVIGVIIYFRKKSEVTTIFAHPHYDMPLDSSQPDYTAKVIESFQMIDNMWSWTKHDDLYSKFRSYEPHIKTALEESFISSGNIPAATEEQRATYDVFCVLQGFALSYCLTMGLSSRFMGNNADTVTKAMMQVFVEMGYLGEEAPVTFNTIDFMIQDKEKIVSATKQKLS